MKPIEKSYLVWCEHWDYCVRYGWHGSGENGDNIFGVDSSINLNWPPPGWNFCPACGAKKPECGS